MFSRSRAVFVSASLMALAPWGFLTCDIEDASGEETVKSTPVFIYYGGREDKWVKHLHFDVAARWAAVPDSIRRHTWLQVRMPPETIYQKKDWHSDRAWDIEPRPNPHYAVRWPRFLDGLRYADENGIPISLAIPRYMKRLDGVPSVAKVEQLVTEHRCIKAIFFSEFACCRFTKIDERHLSDFVAPAQRRGLKFRMSAYLNDRFRIWNFLTAGPKWRGFLRENRQTIIPSYKCVEAIDLMLNWADCVGMWLSGMVNEWCFEFDAWYWPNRFANKHGLRRETYWPKQYPKGGLGMARRACPPYLVKDSMILAALTGCAYFATERCGCFGPRETLRPVFDKAAELILKRRLVRSKDQVLRLARVAVEYPQTSRKADQCGYRYYNMKLGPNYLWKEVFGIPDGGLDLVPNEGRHYIVPVIPPGRKVRKRFRRVLKADEVAQPELLRSVLAEHYPRRFIASDPSVLVFDAGDVLYITDSREENRTTLEFTLESNVEAGYRCTILAQDATPCDVEVATEKVPGGWRKKFILFAGCSALLELKKP